MFSEKGSGFAFSEIEWSKASLFLCVNVCTIINK